LLLEKHINSKNNLHLGYKMEFINFLKNNKNTRKIFGKKELEIIDKQLNGLKLTQSEKNRLSRDIRPKFEFIKDCFKFKNNFNLKKNLLNKILIKNSLNLILNSKFSKNIKAILLFGSFSDNTFHKSSDIDIGVLFSGKSSLRKSTLFRKELLANLNSKVDLQVINVLPLKLKREIVKNHRILYKSKDFNGI